MLNELKSCIAFIGYLNDEKCSLLAQLSTQESHTSFIGCAKSVPALRYKITHSPVKGAVHISEVDQPTAEHLLLEKFLS